MRAVDLDLRELFDFAPEGGILRFAGQRALLLDAVALGLLRRELIATIGMTGARGVLTRFGYAHGWRTAETMKTALPWENEQEWRSAGGRLHRLQGLVLFEPVPRSEAPDAPFAEAVWRDSYEAEQHLLHLGRAALPVCWTLAGFASGYLSCAHGREIICFEDRCVGKGDAICTMVGRPREEWSDGRKAELAYYDQPCLDDALQRVTEALRRTETTLRGRAVLTDESWPEGFIGKSAATRRVVDLARRVAKVDSTVLITGESGVGKELVARLIHRESERLARPYLAVNCAAVPESLLESELFGHARGAFTGAAQDRAGLFEAASGGTLFLDEIGEVPAAMQAKLLRVLQEREIRRVGENKTRRVDVRVITATNRDLAAEVARGTFRQDLYYRLRVIELPVPPLRERREDILPLARFFLAAVAERTGSKVTGFSPKAANQLTRYDFPGNVRELENAVERAVILTDGSRIEPEDLPEEISAAPSPLPPSPSGDLRSLAEVEREHILAVLEASGGNKARAAERLGIGTATLFRKLKEYNAG